MVDKNLVQRFIDLFNYRSEHYPNKKKKIVRLKINGNFVTINGKTTWSDVGHAKSALNQNIYYSGYTENGVHKYLGKEIRKSDPTQDESSNWHEFIDFLEKEGIIEFVIIEE